MWPLPGQQVDALGPAWFQTQKASDRVTDSARAAGNFATLGTERLTYLQCQANWDSWSSYFPITALGEHSCHRAAGGWASTLRRWDSQGSQRPKHGEDV